MEFRQIEYVLGVVEHGGFTRAAAALHVAQPSLSQSVQRLERELGVDLFARIGRRAELTSAGQAFVGPARETLRARDALLASIASVADSATGVLDLVSLPTLAVEPLAGLIGAFRAAHPGVTVRSAEADTTGGLLDAVLDGRAEVGVTELRGVDRRLVQISLGRQHILLVCPPGTPVPASGHLTLRQAVHRPLVAGPVGSSTRDVVDELLARGGLTPTVAVETGHRDAIVPLVLAGAGSAFVPEPVAAAAAARGAVVVPLEPSVTRRIGRRCKEASPLKVAAMPWPARMPLRSRIEVPELPMSSSCVGALRPFTPRPCTRMSRPSSSSSISTPIARNAPMVERTSSPSRQSRISVTPSAKAPNITAR